ncbi:acyltransferase family protein [Alistipes sp. ZOR0009]|uniref:acyltransferase family protein n=1 Tax=Alistipes sp. ZOR0009 TaxID=1339253 RepID=UPI000648BC00|nr:membrane protein [Alistipes sp. ZOR0009]
METTNKSQRLLSLDVLRGITIAGMLLVNTPGSWSSIYEPLEHAAWNGLTPTDLVFPFFMFIMGISMFISLSKTNLTFSNSLFVKLLKRSALIFIIGMAISWFYFLCQAIFDIGSSINWTERVTAALLPFDHIRIPGVLQRLAVCSLVGSIVAVIVPSKHWLKLSFVILVLYYLILLLGNGFVLAPDNIIIRTDIALFGEAHIYHGEGVPFDPEGLISTIPCIAHVLLGAYVGKLLMNSATLAEKMNKLFIFGTICLFVGFLFSYGIPINKKIWTPTYVLATCGLGALLLALLTWIIDVKQQKKWSVFFESFGVNPLFLYVLGGALSILFDTISFHYNDKVISIKGFIYDSLVGLVGVEKLASLLFALLFIAFCWLIGHQLYKRKIYIKL